MPAQYTSTTIVTNKGKSTVTFVTKLLTPPKRVLLQEMLVQSGYCVLHEVALV